MREIESSQIAGAVKELAMSAAVDLEPDILDALVAARDRESSPLSGNVLDLLLINADIASREKIPVCQDTGTGVVFIFLGQEVFIRGDLNAAIQEGVRAAYDEGYLRKSVCDPLTRKNTGTNTPAVVHLDFMPGDRVKIIFLPKGCGSENMSGLAMLPPSSGVEGVVDFVVDRVVQAGPNPCPPVIVGVGIGGNFEKAALLAKMALLRPIGQKSERMEVAELEERILLEINRKGCGVHGFGGDHTALAVNIETFPSHIASLPVAVNIQCHAHRHKEVVI
jgi:fumarate hydratase subunit alpha